MNRKENLRLGKVHHLWLFTAFQFLHTNTSPARLNDSQLEHPKNLPGPCNNFTIPSSEIPISEGGTHAPTALEALRHQERAVIKVKVVDSRGKKHLTLIHEEA